MPESCSPEPGVPEQGVPVTCDLRQASCPPMQDGQPQPRPDRVLVTLLSKLPWRAEEHILDVPTGTTLSQILHQAHFDEPEAHYMLVMNRTVGLPDDVICENTTVTILPVMLGG